MDGSSRHAGSHVGNISQQGYVPLSPMVSAVPGRNTGMLQTCRGKKTCNVSVQYICDRQKQNVIFFKFKMKMCTLFLWSWVFLISQAQKAMRRTKLQHDQREKIKDLILLTLKVTEILCSYDGDVYIWNVSVTRTEFFDRFISPIRSPLHQSTVKLLL